MELSSAVVNELVSRHLAAACVQCHIRLNGDELSAVALAACAENLPDPRLARLKQGYCCRRSCDSYYYRLLLTPHPAVNWEKVSEKLAGTKAPVSSGEIEEGPIQRPKDPAKRALLIKVAAGVGLVLILLIGKHLLSGGSLPGFQRASKYTVDPASVPGVPGP